MCPDCNETHGHKWWCRTARFKRPVYKIVWANGNNIHGNSLVRMWGRVVSPRPQKHLDPAKIAKHGGKLVKI